jgi:hypothetical protein
MPMRRSPSFGRIDYTRHGSLVQGALSYKQFPPLQATETYNLDGILKAMEDQKRNPSD